MKQINYYLRKQTEKNKQGVLGKIKKLADLVKGWTLLPYEEHSLEKAVAMKKKMLPPWFPSTTPLIADNLYRASSIFPGVATA